MIFRVELEQLDRGVWVQVTPHSSLAYGQRSEAEGTNQTTAVQFCTGQQRTILPEIDGNRGEIREATAYHPVAQLVGVAERSREDDSSQVCGCYDDYGHRD